MRYWVRYMLYRHRYRLARFYRRAALAGIFMLLFFFLYYVPVAGALSKILGGSGFSLFSIAVGWSERDPRGLIRSAVPVMAWAGNQEDYPEEITPGSLVTAMLAPFRINLSSPPDLLACEIPALAEFKRLNVAPAVTGAAPVAVPEAPPAASEMTPEALLGIYYTHTGETYALTDGTERLPGQKGGVVEAGRALKDTLERGYGIRVAHDDRVNDQNYSLSYVESEKTARLLLEKNSEVQVILDVHRDAGKSREESLVRVNGKEVAPILIIVGSDARSPFPTWRSNYDFAVKLADRINRKFPGLCIGVRVKEGRYNQFLHPRALLVEIGSVSNSTAEAVQSARMLAEVLAQLIAEIAPDKLPKEKRAAAPASGQEDGRRREVSAGSVSGPRGG